MNERSPTRKRKRGEAEIEVIQSILSQNKKKKKKKKKKREESEDDDDDFDVKILGRDETSEEEDEDMKDEDEDDDDEGGMIFIGGGGGDGDDEISFGSVDAGRLKLVVEGKLKKKYQRKKSQYFRKIKYGGKKSSSSTIKKKKKKKVEKNGIKREEDYLYQLQNSRNSFNPSSFDNISRTDSFNLPFYTNQFDSTSNQRFNNQQFDSTGYQGANNSNNFDANSSFFPNKSNKRKKVKKEEKKKVVESGFCGFPKDENENLIVPEDFEELDVEIITGSIDQFLRNSDDGKKKKKQKKRVDGSEEEEFSRMVDDSKIWGNKDTAYWVREVLGKSLSEQRLKNLILYYTETKKRVKLFAWQEDFLSKNFEGHIIFSFATSGGKTFVAELLMLKRLFSKGANLVMYVVPFKSLVDEVIRNFNELFEIGFDVSVERYYPRKPRKTYQKPSKVVVVCTMEKANSIVNRLLNEGRLSDLSCVVVDEIHMIGEKDRGCFLELMLSKILFYLKKMSGSQKNRSQLIQIIAMSATCPNVSSLSKWIGGKSYTSSTRPVPLNEWVYANNVKFSKDEVLSFKGTDPIPADESREKTSMKIKKEWVAKIIDEEWSAVFGRYQSLSLKSLPYFLDEVLGGSGGVLVFCGSKKTCQDLAEIFSKNFPFQKAPKETKERYTRLMGMYKENLMEIPSLPSCIRGGFAFHHSSLCRFEKEEVETGFKMREIRVLFCTTTLAAGVNLPAGKVIILNPPERGYHKLTVQKYRQIAGRSGRFGIDNVGESVLFYPHQRIKVLSNDSRFNILRKGLPDVTSDLGRKNGFPLAVLEFVCFFREFRNKCSTKSDISEYVELLFYSASRKEVFPLDKVIEELSSKTNPLIETGFSKEEIYKGTTLGNAIFLSSLSCPQGTNLFRIISAFNYGEYYFGTHLQTCYVLTWVTRAPLVYGEKNTEKQETLNDLLRKFFADIFAKEKLKRSIKSILRSLGKEMENHVILETYGRGDFLDFDDDRTFVEKLVESVVLVEILNGEDPEGIIDRYALTEMRITKEKILNFVREVKVAAQVVSFFCELTEMKIVKKQVRTVLDMLSLAVKEEVLNLMNSMVYENSGKIEFELRKDEATKLYQKGCKTAEDICFTHIDRLLGFFEEEGKERPKKKRKLDNSQNPKSLLEKRCDEIKEYAEKVKIRKESMYENADEVGFSIFNIQDSRGTEKLLRNTSCEIIPDLKALIRFCATWKEQNKSNEGVGFELALVQDSNHAVLKLDDILGISFCPDIKTVFWLDMNDDKQVLREKLKILKKEFFEESSIVKVCFNIQKTLGVLLKLNIRVNKFVDPLLICYFTNGLSHSFSLTNSRRKHVRMVKEALNHFHDHNENCSVRNNVDEYESCILNSYAGGKRYSKVMSSLSFHMFFVCEYQYRNCSGIACLHEISQILSELDCLGIGFDEAKSYELLVVAARRRRKFEKDFQNLLKKLLEMELKDWKGYLRSHDRLRMLLFSSGFLNLPKGRKTEKNLLSTSKESLTYVIGKLGDQSEKIKLRSEKIELLKVVLDWRDVDKMVSSGNRIVSYDTNSSSRREFVMWNQINGFGFRINSSLSSTRKEVSLKDTGKSVYGGRFLYIPRSGYKFVSFDYCNLEVRILAAFCHDDKLIAHLHDEKKDFFDHIKNSVSKKMLAKNPFAHVIDRKKCKTIIYGLLYGKGDESLAKDLNVDEKKASEIRDSLFEVYPGLCEYFQGLNKYLNQVDLSKDLEKFGKSLGNRVPNISRSKPNYTGKFRNAIISGSASDIFRKTLVQLGNELFEVFGKKEYSKIQNQDYYLNLVLHDEVMYEVKNSPKFINVFVTKVKTIMEKVPRRFFGVKDVSFPVKVTIGKSWGEQIDFETY